MVKIDIDRNSSRPIRQQIEEQLRSLINGNVFTPGARIPSEREMAKFLGVSRPTVSHAYKELKREGYISANGNWSTVVAAINKANQQNKMPHTKIKWSNCISKRVGSLKKRSDDEVLRIINRRDLISFVGRWTCFPGTWTDELPLPDEMLEYLAAHPGDRDIVSPLDGLESFKQAIGGMMSLSGRECGPENMVITRGGVHGLEMVANALLNPGDIVLCEEPTYHMAALTFRKIGAHLIGVPMTEHGMDLDALETMLNKKYYAKFIYTMPNVHNPCGITTSAAHRERLLGLSQKYDTPILEDDPYWGMTLDADYAMTTLKAMDDGNHVIFIGTFSKAVSPRLELGWICAPRMLVKAINLILGLTVMNSNTPSQLMTQRFIETGAIYKHIDKIRQMDRDNEALFQKALLNNPIPGLTWFKSASGPFHTLELPAGMSATALVKEAGKRGVAVLPGQLFSVIPANSDRFIRIGLRFIEKPQIVCGLKILLDTIAGMAADGAGL